MAGKRTKMITVTAVGTPPSLPLRACVCEVLHALERQCAVEAEGQAATDPGGSSQRRRTASPPAVSHLVVGSLRPA
jgi:hypothetical protein